jgi:glycosyltransferase involved in cell wall biosynthesis
LAADVDVELGLVYHVASGESSIRQYAKRLRLANVRFLGVKSPLELSRIYARAHVVVLPSRLKEALPSVITEAMLVGRPIVASHFATVVEQLDGFGITSPPGAPAELARAIQVILENYPAYIDRAAATSRSARQRFSIAGMVEQHVALYQHVCAHSIRQRRAISARPVALLARSLTELTRMSSRSHQ